MLSEKLVQWGSIFVIIYAVCVIGFYIVGAINARVCEALCSLPCFSIAAWYLVAGFEERRVGRSNGTIISSVGWSLVGIAFLLPASVWAVRLISACIGLFCIVAGCAIGFLRAVKQFSQIEVEGVSSEMRGGKTPHAEAGEESNGEADSRLVS
ncbi:MAG: hypothetical protein RMK18_02335 [Armatimonadota bacterium]|nr:hypothetical protein [Armatimonadota bacterium]MCX7777625.1 hypothetical protein [Armatimonadota bacterium]MDW8024696.1 hypothetical protein [Armatimonadota bacterium]